MNVPGHLAMAYLAAGPRPFGQSWRERVRRQIFPVCLGALTPDLIDKTMMLLDVVPWGRLVGHAIVVWTGIGLVWLLWRWAGVFPIARRMFGFFVTGGLSHLLADVTDDVLDGLLHTGVLVSTWFAWPVANADTWYVEIDSVPFPCKNCYTLYEMAIIGLGAWYFLRWDGQDRL